MKRILLLTLFLLLLFSCKYDYTVVSSDLIVATVNLGEDNKDSKIALEDGLKKDADILVLGEYDDSEEWRTLIDEYGYKLPDLSSESFPVVTDGKYKLFIVLKDGIDILATGSSHYGSFADKNYFLAYRIKIKEEYLSIIGINFSDGGFISEPLINFFSPLLDLVEDGLLTVDFAGSKKGDKVIFAGDFHSLPTSLVINKVERVGFIDSHDVDTYLINNSYLDIARVDYIFHPESIVANFTGTFSLTGSLHRGVITGFKIK